MNDELHRQEKQLETKGRTKVEQLLRKLEAAYNALSPEKQTVFGVFATYIYMIMLISPESLPQRIQPMIESLNKMPLHNISLWITTMVVFVGSVDGVRRIVTQRLPFYKAYVQVFLLGAVSESEEDEG